MSQLKFGGGGGGSGAGEEKENKEEDHQQEKKRKTKKTLTCFSSGIYCSQALFLFLLLLDS